MTDPNAISPTPETSGGEDRLCIRIGGCLKKLLGAGVLCLCDHNPKRCTCQEHVYYRRNPTEYAFALAEAASRLSPPSSSGEEGEAVWGVLEVAGINLNDEEAESLRAVLRRDGRQCGSCGGPLQERQQWVCPACNLIAQEG